MPDHVLRAELEGDEVLLNTSTGVYHLVNATGKAVLSELDRSATLDEAVSSISRSFGTEEATVRQDVVRFLDALERSGLLEKAD